MLEKRRGLKKTSLPFDLLKTQLQKIDRRINRLVLQTYKAKQNQRAARTRTLIQLGGLVVKSGLTKKLGIQIGADLQQEEDQRKKAYAFLGILIQQLSVDYNKEDLEKIGRQFFADEEEIDNEGNMFFGELKD